VVIIVDRKGEIFLQLAAYTVTEHATRWHDRKEDRHDDQYEKQKGTAWALKTWWSSSFETWMGRLRCARASAMNRAGVSDSLSVGRV
jgi:hypothetical protein